MSIYAFPLAFSIVNGLIFTGLFWLRSFRDERQSDFLMGCTLLAACVYILDYTLGYMGIHVMYEAFQFFPFDVGLLIGPLLYFYLKSQLNINFSFSRKEIKHFVPYAIYFSFHLLVFLTGKAGVQRFLETIHWPLHIGDVEMVLDLASNVFYLYLSLKLIQEYQRWLPTQYADIETISFNWYRIFLLVFAFSIAVNWVYVLIGMAGVSLDFSDIWWGKFVVAITIYFTCLRGYMQVQPKNLSFVQESIESSIENSIETTSEVPIPDLELWKKKVLNTMEAEKRFLEPEISLADLANQLKTNTSFLSAVINKGFSKNFNDFVNEFRVQEFQKQIKLPENQNITLLGVAFDCGFNSKTTFNRVIKKQTGKAPKEFLK